MAAQEADDAPLRPTGGMERFNIVRNHVKFYNNFQVAARYNVPLGLLGSSPSVDNLRDVVYAALTETLNHQPFMSVNIEDEGTREPRWRRIARLDLRSVVEVVDVDPTETMDHWIGSSHHVEFVAGEDMPLWRVVVAAKAPIAIDNSSSSSTTFSFIVAFFCHHAICDGISAGAFHLTFLDALNHLIAHPDTITASNPMITPPKLALVPSLEQGTSLPVGLLFTAKEIVKALFYNPVDRQAWTGPPISATAPRPPLSSHRSFFLSQPIVGALLTLSKQEKTTITTLVTVLVARRLAALHPDFQHFVATIPFSLRKFSGHTNRQMACCISNVTMGFAAEERMPSGFISCKGESGSQGERAGDGMLWESARACKARIDARTKSPNDQNVGLLKFIPDVEKFFLGLLGGRRAHAFEVTNIGVLDGKVGEGKGNVATFDRCLFTTGMSLYCDPYCVSIVSAKGGDMSVTVNWQVGAADEEEAVGLASWLEEQLRGLAGDEK